MSELLRDAFHTLTDVEGMIRWGGTALVCLIVFVETGLFVGFFLPGDSLLVTAGFVSATFPDVLTLWEVIVALCIAAIVGDSTGYYIGKKAGQALYNRPPSRFFRRDHLLKTKAFYEKYGGITIVLARFIPFARTFAPVVAGIGDMEYRRFLSFNIFGGIGWVVAMSLLGYLFGNIPFVQKHIEKAIVLVIILSVLPVIIHVWKSKGQAAAAPADPPADPGGETQAH